MHCGTMHDGVTSFPTLSNPDRLHALHYCIHVRECAEIGLVYYRFVVLDRCISLLRLLPLASPLYSFLCSGLTHSHLIFLVYAIQGDAMLSAQVFSNSLVDVKREGGGGVRNVMCVCVYVESPII